MEEYDQHDAISKYECGCVYVNGRKASVFEEKYLGNAKLYPDSTFNRRGAFRNLSPLQIPEGENEAPHQIGTATPGQASLGDPTPKSNSPATPNTWNYPQAPPQSRLDGSGTRPSSPDGGGASGSQAQQSPSISRFPPLQEHVAGKCPACKERDQHESEGVSPNDQLNEIGTGLRGRMKTGIQRQVQQAQEKISAVKEKVQNIRSKKRTRVPDQEGRLPLIDRSETGDNQRGITYQENLPFRSGISDEPSTNSSVVSGPSPPCPFDDADSNTRADQSGNKHEDLTSRFNVEPPQTVHPSRSKPIFKLPSPGHDWYLPRSRSRSPSSGSPPSPKTVRVREKIVPPATQFDSGNEVESTSREEISFEPSPPDEREIKMASSFTQTSTPRLQLRIDVPSAGKQWITPSGKENEPFKPKRYSEAPEDGLKDSSEVLSKSPCRHRRQQSQRNVPLIRKTSASPPKRRNRDNQDSSSDRESSLTQLPDSFSDQQSAIDDYSENDAEQVDASAERDDISDRDQKIIYDGLEVLSNEDLETLCRESDGMEDMMIADQGEMITKEEFIRRKREQNAEISKAIAKMYGADSPTLESEGIFIPETTEVDSPNTKSKGKGKARLKYTTSSPASSDLDTVQEEQQASKDEESSKDDDDAIEQGAASSLPVLTRTASHSAGMLFGGQTPIYSDNYENMDEYEREEREEIDAEILDFARKQSLRNVRDPLKLDPGPSFSREASHYPPPFSRSQSPAPSSPPRPPLPLKSGSLLPTSPPRFTPRIAPPTGDDEYEELSWDTLAEKSAAASRMSYGPLPVGHRHWSRQEAATRGGDKQHRPKLPSPLATSPVLSRAPSPPKTPNRGERSSGHDMLKGLHQALEGVQAESGPQQQVEVEDEEAESPRKRRRRLGLELESSEESVKKSEDANDADLEMRDVDFREEERLRQEMHESENKSRGKGRL